MAANDDTCSTGRSSETGGRHRNRGRPHRGDGRRLQDHVNRRQCACYDNHYGCRADIHGFRIQQANADRIEDQAKGNAHQVADGTVNDGHANGDAAGRGPHPSRAAPASHIGTYGGPDHTRASIAAARRGCRVHGELPVSRAD
jgi:hypothetical protein